MPEAINFRKLLTLFVFIGLAFGKVASLWVWVCRNKQAHVKFDREKRETETGWGWDT